MATRIHKYIGNGILKRTQSYEIIVCRIHVVYDVYI